MKENMRTVSDNRQGASYTAHRSQCENKEAEPKRRAIRLIDKARTRARKRDIEFRLTKQWVLDALTLGTCAVTGIPFDLENGRGSRKHNKYAPTIDRIDPTKGYTSDNCQLVISQYNMAKGEWEHGDVIAMAHVLLGSHECRGSSKRRFEL